MSSSEGRRYVRTEQFGSLKEHVLALVSYSGPHGWTTPELVKEINRQTPDAFTAYSNPVSGALSVLHNVDEKIVRLHHKRGGFSVYVTYDKGNIAERDYYLPRPPGAPEDIDLDTFRAEGWNEAVKAFDWALQHGTPRDAMIYLRGHCPFGPEPDEE